MRFTRSSVILAVAGALLIVAGLLVRFAVLPSVNKLPGDLNSTVQYQGGYTGINPAALSGAAGNPLVRDVPSTASRTIATDSVDGNTAVVTETVKRTIGGQAQPVTADRFAVDRVDYGSVAAPSGAQNVVASKGQIFSLPQNPSTTTTYQLWDSTTSAAYPMKYQKTTTLEGRTVYDYRWVAKGSITNPAALGLPTSLSKAQVTGLAPTLASLLPADVVARLQGVLSQLPATIPLTWTSTRDATFSVDSRMGTPIKTASSQQINAQLPLGIASVPFSTLTLTSTAASRKSTADDGSSNATKLTWIGTITPIVLVVLGLFLVVGALLLARRNAGSAAPGGTAGRSGAQRTSVPA